jgi:glycine/sarcosine N-methyltransferase
VSEQTRQFYDQLADDYHLIFADWRAAVRRQGKLLDQLIRAEGGEQAHTVLDCACGIGTQAIGLALCGYDVRASDISAVEVARAEREAASFGVSLSATVADFRTLAADVPGAFDVVIACDNALPHLLTDAEMRQAADNIYAKVAAGGLFIASTRDYDLLVQERPPVTPVSVFDDAIGRRISFQVWDWAADGRTYAVQHFIIKQANGHWQTGEQEMTYRAWQRAEMSAIFATAGFNHVRWLMPEQSNYYQPMIIAHKGG